MKKPEVLIRYPCKTCEGIGVVESPAWREFYEKKMHEKSEEEQLNFWSSWGYSLRDLPPEEVECATCWGKGVIEKWISIGELAEHISEFLK